MTRVSEAPALVTIGAALVAGWRKRARNLAARAGRHRAALVWLALASVLGQTVVFVQTPLVSPWTLDSAQYLADARHILLAHQIFDPLRTPVYPALLALIFTATGGQHLGAVVVVQAALGIAAAFEIYALALWVGARRWLAVLVGVWMAVDPYILMYERCVLTETLTYWLVVTLLLTFASFARRQTPGKLAALVALSAAAILTRPNLIYLPALLLGLLVLGVPRFRRVGRGSATLGAASLVIYGAVVLYMVGNVVTYGYFGLSYLTNQTLFEKVFEYRLYALPFVTHDPAVARLHAEVLQLVRSGRASLWWRFDAFYPDAARHYWEVPRELAVAEIEQHPFVYVTSSVPDVMAVSNARLFLPAPLSYAPGWLAVVVAAFAALARVYVFWPVLLVAAGTRAWRGGWRTPYLVQLALVAIVGAHTIITGMVDFTELWRLRFPVEWVIDLMFVVMVTDLVVFLAGWLARIRRTRASGQPVAVGK